MLCHLICTPIQIKYKKIYMYYGKMAKNIVCCQSHKPFFSNHSVLSKLLIVTTYMVLNNSRRAFYAMTQEKFDDFFSCFCCNLIKFLVMGKIQIQTKRKEMKKKNNIHKHINIQLHWIHRRHWEMSSEKTMHEITQSNLKNLHDTKPKARR